ncbi:MAG: mannonate dehydratase [Bacillota bacterium]|jgi:mannonate dehydratase|nr:mannonate dehydratase [Bacillota bacterium]HHU43019.1 mannonate dehydratase [Clostridiales bacterium]
MKMTFRWFGEDDKVTLDEIRQIPVIDGIVTALSTPPGEAWEEKDIMRLKKTINDKNLEFEVVESVPVHEDIKLGAPSRDRYIDNYTKTIKRLGKAGVKVICYNFMPVFDWMRSDLHSKNEDDSISLAYDNDIVNKLNPLNLSDDLNLPAWDKTIGKERMKELLNIYKDFTEDRFFDNLKYFLDRIIPAAEESGVKMAIHPDDPPWSIYGLPRIIGNKDNLRRFLSLYESEHNGVTFCVGSFGSTDKNNLYDMIEIAKGRIHFVHMRNVLITGEKSFRETAHPSKCGSLDMYKILKTLYDNGFDCYIRPDHGRQIWSESGNRVGYGLYDRALGAMYLYGLMEAIIKGGKE